MLPRLKGIVDEPTYQHIARILTFGCPAKINAHFSAQQVKEYRIYGNHKTTRGVYSLISNTPLTPSTMYYTLYIDAKSYSHFRLKILSMRNILSPGIINTTRKG